MKKHFYIGMEAILSVFVLALFAIRCVIDFNVIVAVLVLLASLYFLYKIVIGVKLLIDILGGANERSTVFMGCAGEEYLDFFYKISYSNIFFDDDLLTKNYRLFHDVYDGQLHQGDRITVVYYQRSRIVLQLKKTEDGPGLAGC